MWLLGLELLPLSTARVRSEFFVGFSFLCRVRNLGRLFPNLIVLLTFMGAT